MTPKTVNWDEIEPHWRAGLLSKMQIANMFGVSRAAMDKHFNKHGVERDLAPAIRAKTAAMVTRSVAHELQCATEKEIIEAAAATQTGIILKHRKGIGKLQALVDNMTAELFAQSMTQEDLNHVAELVALTKGQEQEVTPQQVQKQVDAFAKLMALAPRVDTLNKLASSMKTLVGMERQAFGLSDNANGEADKEQEAKPSDNETARRVAFVMMTAIRNKQKTIEHE